MKPAIRRAASVALALVLALCVSLPVVASSGEPAGAGAHGMGFTPTPPALGNKLTPPAPGAGTRTVSATKDLSGNAPPIGDQGNQNSCVGWAAGYYAKTWYEKKEHPSWDLGRDRYRSSPSFVYNQINGGLDKGASFYDALVLLEETGCTDLEEFPYNSDYRRQPDGTDVEAARQYRNSADWGYFFIAGGWGPFSRANVVTELKQRLNGGDPILMGIPIYRDFPNWGGNPASKYYDYNGHSTLAGGHGVFVAGYDDNVNPAGSDAAHRGGFLVLNSWGPKWNGNGRVYLSYDFVQRYVPEAWGMSDADSAPAISSIDPSSGSAGQTVTINGNNLGAARRGARVAFPGGDGQVVSWANSRIKVRVPETSTGTVYAYDWDGVRSNGRSFTSGSSPLGKADWFLAEGATWPGFDEWVLLQNPNESASTVSVDFLTHAGPAPGTRVTVPPLSRVTLHVNDLCPNADVSTVVTVESGPRICAERAMYFATPDGKRGSHGSIGAQAAASTWYLAEGATHPGYDEWIMVMNPNDEEVSVRTTWLTPGGAHDGPALSVPARSRKTVHVNEHVGYQDVSAKLECVTAGAGIVVERSMYVNTADGKVDCHNSVGVSETWSAWALAEGATLPGFEEWVLVMNPGRSTAHADVVFLTPGGFLDGPSLEIGAGQRVSVRVNDYAPNREVSTMVMTGGDDQQIIAERAMYISGEGKRGAHNSPGSIYASRSWLLPEGRAAAGFDEWVLVMNPGDVEANVRLDFMTSNGVVGGPSATVAPLSRKTFHVNDYCSGDVSTRVTADERVIAERAMYISAADGKWGATSSLGVPASLVTGAPGTYGVADAWRPARP